MKRHTSSLCQSCYSEARPDRYFPETFRIDVCCACGDITYAARVTKGETQQVAYTLYADPADRVACCAA